MELIDIDIAKLRTSRKYSSLRTLTVASSLGVNTRLNREITVSQNGGAFKIWKPLMRTLQPSCRNRKFRRLISWLTMCVCVCVCIRAYMHIYPCLFKMIVGVLLSRRTYTPNSGNTHNLTMQFEIGVHSFKRHVACVFWNGRYDSEPPLKPSPLTCYK